MQRDLTFFWYLSNVLQGWRFLLAEMSPTFVCSMTYNRIFKVDFSMFYKTIREDASHSNLAAFNT